MHAVSIADVLIQELTPHVDGRGRFTEIYRKSWNNRPSNVQWNCVQSQPGVLRGVHVHAIHHDYLFVAAGTLVLGLHDIRPESSTFRSSGMIVLDAKQPLSVAIPPGICHGFYFPVDTIHVYAVSNYWNSEDELGCRFDCPELGLDWPNWNPTLSERDTNADDYAKMCRDYAQATGTPKLGKIR